jgi:hypothetical protein
MGDGEDEEAEEEQEEEGRKAFGMAAKETAVSPPLAVCPSARLYITCKRLGY